MARFWFGNIVFCCPPSLPSLPSTSSNKKLDTHTLTHTLLGREYHHHCPPRCWNIVGTGNKQATISPPYSIRGCYCTILHALHAAPALGHWPVYAGCFGVQVCRLRVAEVCRGGFPPPPLVSRTPCLFLLFFLSHAWLPLVGRVYDLFSRTVNSVNNHFC